MTNASSLRINTGSTPTKKAGMNCYLMGETIAKSNSKYWTYLDGHKFNTVGTKKYTSLSAAKTACKKATSKCRGVFKKGTKKYYLATSPLVTPKTGNSVYFKGGPVIKVCRLCILPSVLQNSDLSMRRPLCQQNTSYKTL